MGVCTLICNISKFGYFFSFFFYHFCVFFNSSFSVIAFLKSGISVS